MKSQDSSSHDDISESTSTSIGPKEDVELQHTATSRDENAEKIKVLWGLIDRKIVRKVIAEALGTFMLVFCINGIMANLKLMGVETGLLEYAATAGLTVIVIVFSLGTISGGHVNPAVTIAFATIGPFPWSEVPLYILGQVGGSVLATYCGQFVYGLKPNIAMTVPLHGLKAAFCVEFIATFIILFLITSLIRESQPPKESSGFVVGVSIALGVLITGPISGGSMNPARSLGPALVSWRFEHVWIYLVAPTLGAISGVAAYRILRLKGWSCDFVQAPRAVPVNVQAPKALLNKSQLIVLE